MWHGFGVMEHSDLVISTLSSHFQGWGFDSHLHPVCMECVFFLCLRGLLWVLCFSPTVLGTYVAYLYIVCSVWIGECVLLGALWWVGTLSSVSCDLIHKSSGIDFRFHVTLWWTNITENGWMNGSLANDWLILFLWLCFIQHWEVYECLVL